jgi:signal transduction histidine kinase
MSESSMGAELAAELQRIPPGGHICLFYDKDPVEQLPAIVAFVQDSLVRDEKFVYVADDQTVEQITAYLKVGGVDVQSEISRGRLAFWTRDNWRQPGELDSLRKAAQVRGFINEAANAGFKGVRFAVEMTWTLGPDISAEKLEHWEATINTLFDPAFPGRIICQYNRSRLSSNLLLAALRTHPIALLGQNVYPNFFYQAPLILNGNGNGQPNGRAGTHANGNGSVKSSEARLDWMLSQLQRARDAERIRVEAEVLRRTNEALVEAREELLRANQDLERRVEERTAALRETITQMEEFSYSVSHDLRGPVRAMQGFARAVLEDYAERLDECGQNYLQRIVTASDRMDRLIKDVLTYSRAGRREIELHPVSLERLLRDIIQQLPDTQPPRAEITLKEELLAVQAHEPSLAQALSNLLGNAVKFIAAGVTPRIEIWTEPRDRDVRLWIKDNGIGIKPEHQPRLFGMFVRLHPESRYEGTGVGLAIVRKVVDRMGGRVGVVSDGVHGSSFWLELPGAEGLAEPKAAIDSESVPGLVCNRG